MVRRVGSLVMVITALLVGAAAAQASTARYVAKSGSDTANDCTVPTAPCLTIGHAVTRAAAGDMVVIGPGTFSEAVTVSKNNLTFIGSGSSGAGATFVDASATTSPGFAIGGENTTFESLHIRGGFSAAGRILGAIEGGGSPAPAVTIGGCLLDQPSPASPTNWDAAIDVETGTAALTIANTTISGYQGGIVIDAGTGGSLSMSDDTVTEPFIPVPMGLHIVQGSTAAVLTGVPASITDSNLTATDGLRVDDTQATVVRTVVHASSVGASLGDGPGTPSLTMRDTVIAPGGGSMPIGIGVGNLPSAAPASVSLTGVSLLAISDTTPHALDASMAAANSTIQIRNSILQAIDPGGTTNEDIASDVTPLTWDVGFTAFTTSTGTGVPAPGSGTNIDAAPQYVDDLLGDLHLQPTSPLFDKGDPSQVEPGETDVTGAPRAVDHDCDGIAQPDLGAYEAPAPICPAPPAPPAPGPPPKDTTPPLISSLSFDPTKFAADHTHPSHGRHKESTLRFTLSEAATLKVDVEVVVHHGGGHPATYTIIGSVTYHGEQAGADTRTFSGLVGAHPLHSAEYRAIVIATDAAGNVSSHHHLYFTVDNA